MRASFGINLALLAAALALAGAVQGRSIAGSDCAAIAAQCASNAAKQSNAPECYIPPHCRGSQTNKTLPAPHVGCDSPLYCPGELLDTVQSAHLEKDSKYFVDQATSKPLDQVLRAYQALPKPPTRDQVKAFVDANFLPAGAEIGPVTLTDYHDSPAFLDKIRDPKLRHFAHEVHRRWHKLGRMFRSDVLCDGCVSSALPAKHPFVVPGGRFREFYYWDSYFVMEGLLISGMHQTVKGMIENALTYVDEYGFMPNGARIYFLNRSQPPLLTQMVKLYIDATDDTTFLKRALPTLEKEHAFWLHNRTVTVSAPGDQPVRLAVYKVDNDQPRPESWREDKETAEQLPVSKRAAYFSDMASGAESGWDYSSRWFANGTELASIATDRVVPVDLNSMLYMNERTMAAFAERIDQPATQARFAAAADERRTAIQRYMWSDDDAQWHDFNRTSRRREQRFYASNIVPLWSGAFDNRTFTPAVAERLVESIRPAVNYPAGMPTSLVNSGQQWDFPNAWPPLEHFVVYGLLNAGVPSAKALAEELAQKWIASNYCGWLVTGGDGQSGPHNNGTMFEKYDATRLGIPGLGGEYEVQEGFGWTNGVVLAFLDRMGDLLKAPDSCPPLPATFKLSP